ncbi:MAG TPA: DUF3084 domain-containing protein [Chthonomonadales bacterium]|nr:DUF3084 domain-containing protein [Chthonomonadales bacterium]
MLTILALFCLVLLGGFISYFGDLQGRRWGKRRVSWFGLRPKHTAILITSITGSAIVLLSILTLLAIVPPVREVVVRGESAVRENKQLLADLTKQRADSSRLVSDEKATLRLTRADLRQMSAELERARTEYAGTRNELDRTKAVMLRAEMERAALERRNLALETDYTRTKASLPPLISRQRALRSLVRDEETANRRAGFVNKDLGRQNLQLSRQNEDLDKRNSQLETRNADLTATESELNLRISGLQSKLADLTTTIQSLETQKKLDERTLAARDQYENQAAADMHGAAQTIADTVLTFRKSTISLRARGELARCVIPAHTRPEAVRVRLVNLLDEASAAARIYGAGAGPNGRTVVLVGEQRSSLAEDSSGYEQEEIDQVAAALAGNAAPVLITVNATDNCIAGEQAPVAIHTFNVIRVFNKGSILASRILNIDQNENSLVDEIVDFLQNDVRAAAIQEIVPRIDPLTGTEQIGSLGPKEMFLLTERVRRFHGKIKIAAVAARAITSADTLEMQTDPDSGNADGQPSTAALKFRITRVRGG